MTKMFPLATAMLSLMASLMLGACDAPSKAVTSFNACVLENMKGATSDVAATSIKESCIRTVEKPLTAEMQGDLKSAKAVYGEIFGHLGHNLSGLYVTLNNSSLYTISEFVVLVTKKQNNNEHNLYVVRSFTPPIITTAEMAATPLMDKTTEMVLPPGQHTFTIPISENAQNNAEFFETYDWAIVGVRGFEN